MVGRLSPWPEHMPDLSTYIRRTISGNVFADPSEEIRKLNIETVKAEEKQYLPEACCCAVKGLSEKKGRGQR